MKGLESVKQLNRKGTIEVLCRNAFVNLFFLLNQVYGWNSLRDGNLKQLDTYRDSWFFVDYEHGDIKAPGKWQGFLGYYLFRKPLSQHLNKYLSASLVLTINNLKEYEEAYKEVLSLSDIYTDFSGILSGTFNNRKYKPLRLYDNEKITMNLYVNLDF